MFPPVAQVPTEGYFWEGGGTDAGVFRSLPLVEVIICEMEGEREKILPKGQGREKERC